MTKDNNCPVCGSECIIDKPPHRANIVKLHRIAIEQGEALDEQSIILTNVLLSERRNKEEIERLKDEKHILIERVRFVIDHYDKESKEE